MTTKRDKEIAAMARADQAEVDAILGSSVSGSVVRSWKTRELASFIGVTVDLAKRTLLPKMLEAGVIGRHGRVWFARTGDIEAWLLGRLRSPATVTVTKLRRVP